MKLWIYFLLVLGLAACAPDVAEINARELGYPDLGAAPELSGEVWLNIDAPLRLADLRGKVVLIDMWTFG